MSDTELIFDMTIRQLKKKLFLLSGASSQNLVDGLKLAIEIVEREKRYQLEIEKTLKFDKQR